MMNAIVEAKWFHAVVFLVISLNAAVLGLETIPAVQSSYGTVLDSIDTACLWIFVVEMIVRVLACRINFFKSGWNWFDIVVIALSFIPAACSISSLRVIRLLRQIRTLRLVTRLRTLRIILNAVFKSIPSLGHAVVLLLVLLYVYAIIGVNLFNDVEQFNSLGSAMLTLVVTTTFEGWGDLMNATMALHSYAWIYYITFIILSALIMLNIVVGIVVSFVQEAYEKEHSQQKAATVDSNLFIEEMEGHVEQLRKLIENQKKS